MTKTATNNTISIVAIDGKPKKINERVIDSQWIQYLGEFARVVGVSPLKLLKLFGGSMERWLDEKHERWVAASQGFKEICDESNVQVFYANLPKMTPYLLMARNELNLDIGFKMIAHSVGSEFWLKHWITLAPLLREQDTVITATASCKKALENISGVYQSSTLLPLCLSVGGSKLDHTMEPQIEDESRLNEIYILSIGRIEEVKNIHVAIEVLRELKKQFPNVRLVIAGEYTGTTQDVIASYRSKLQHLINEYELDSNVEWTGPIDGEIKTAYFQKAQLLLNLSTDPGETFGFNLIEAKNFGLPVVCTQWDGFSEIIRHGVDGFLVECEWKRGLPTFDPCKVAEYCSRVLRDEHLRKMMSDNALVEAKKYDYKIIMPQIIHALDQKMKLNLTGYTKEIRNREVVNTSLEQFAGLYTPLIMDNPTFARETIYSLLTSNGLRSNADWMSIAYPFIEHFSGGNSIDQH